MDRTHQVGICKTCTNQAFDMNKGVICGLTNDIGNFEAQCTNFTADEQAIKDVEEENARRNSYGIGAAGPLQKIKKGANWFYWIGALSLINSLILLNGSQYNFIAGLGITQIFDAILMEILGGYTILCLIPSIFFSSIFAGLGYAANKHYKAAFFIGLIFYGFDSLLYLLATDLFSVAFHAFAFFMIYKGYRSLKEIEASAKPATVEIN